MESSPNKSLKEFPAEVVMAIAALLRHAALGDKVVSCAPCHHSLDSPIRGRSEAWEQGACVRSRTVSIKDSPVLYSQNHIAWCVDLVRLHSIWAHRPTIDSEFSHNVMSAETHGRHLHLRCKRRGYTKWRIGGACTLLQRVVPWHRFR